MEDGHLGGDGNREGDVRVRNPVDEQYRNTLNTDPVQILDHVMVGGDVMVEATSTHTEPATESVVEVSVHRSILRCISVDRGSTYYSEGRGLEP